MLFISSLDMTRHLDIVQDAGNDIHGFMKSIQALAMQVVCYSADMETAGREDLLRLPIPRLPKPARELSDLFRHETMETFLSVWAQKRGFRIDHSVYHGPQIVWLQSGGLSARVDRISIFVVLQAPKSGGSEVDCVTGAVDGEAFAAPQSPSPKVFIRSPIGGSLFVKSTLDCQVGDIVVLEGGETILMRPKEDATGGEGICMLSTLHLTSPQMPEQE